MKAALFALLASASFCFALEIEMVEVGNPDNPPHPETGLGSVSYLFRISRTEITNEQYAEFLNAVASDGDPHGLFHPLMSSSERGGIQRKGSEGSYHYSSKDGLDQHPATFLSWYQAARFVNWLHNGKGDSDTEDGAYTLNGATDGIVTRNPDAAYWIPNSNEWYKAAYYDPTRDENSGYWKFPTRSDAIPQSIPPNSAEANAGNLSGAQNTDVKSVPVGSYPASVSFYGTHDQAGNLLEYTDELGVRGDLVVAVWGGNYNFGPEHTAAFGTEANPMYIFPSHNNDSATFRIAGKL